MVTANLARHLPAAPGRAVDVGGGTGTDAIQLAADGYQVTVLDHSAAMLAEAQRRFAAAGLADRLTVVQGDAAAIGGVLEAHAYDLALCHNVRPYVADAPASSPTVPAWSAGVGCSPSPVPTPTRRCCGRALHDQDLPAAYAAVGTSTAHTAVFDTPVSRQTPAAVIELLHQVGAHVVGHYGVRTVCDYLADDDRKHDPAFYADLEKLELALADRMPYPWIARQFHLIATT